MKRDLPLRLVAVAVLWVIAASRPMAAQHNTWRKGAPLPTAVWCPMVAVLEGKIYVVAGVGTDGTAIGDTQVYDPVSDTWSTAAPLPVTNCAGVAATVKGVLYVIGGYPYTDAVWAYIPQTNSWSARAPMPTPRTDMGVAVLNGIIYVVGGNTYVQNRVSIVETYDPSSDTWTERAPLPIGKSEPSVGVFPYKTVGFAIVAADGYTIGGDTGDNADYIPSKDVWVSIAPDPLPRNAACSGRIGPALFVAGGYLGFGSALDTNEAFILSINSWKRRARMPSATLFGGSAVYKGKLYCIGGSKEFSAEVLSDVQIYQP